MSVVSRMSRHIGPILGVTWHAVAPPWNALAHLLYLSFLFPGGRHLRLVWNEMREKKRQHPCNNHLSHLFLITTLIACIADCDARPRSHRIGPYYRCGVQAYRSQAIKLFARQWRNVSSMAALPRQVPWLYPGLRRPASNIGPRAEKIGQLSPMSRAEISRRLAC